MSTATKPANAAAQEIETEDLGFLEGMAGQGFEDMGANATSIAYLSLVQPDSGAEDDDSPAGTWRNSATGRNYGNDVKVIVLGFRTIWSEREADPPFRTVGRYPVGGIQVELRQPPKGKRGYPKMINPESGNEVQELFVYAITLPEYPEDGILYFNPTVGSMKTANLGTASLKASFFQMVCRLLSSRSSGYFFLDLCQIRSNQVKKWQSSLKSCAMLS